MKYAKIFLLTLSLLMCDSDRMIAHMRWYELAELFRYGSADDVDTVFRKGGYSVNLSAKNGITVLTTALIESSGADVVRYLVGRGADVNTRIDSGLTPLMLAVYYSNGPEIPAILIHAGADTNAKSDDGYTALDIAEALSKPQEIITLLKHASE